MNSNLRQKIPKYKSRAGMSLTELIVGVTIIALVLGSAAGAIVTGYKTTIDNAERILRDVRQTIDELKNEKRKKQKPSEKESQS